MEIKRAINIEDDVFKHTAISRALKSNGIGDVVWKKSAEEGMAEIEEAIQLGTPYQLLILDMHFPLRGRQCENAGEYVIKELRDKNIELPIIVCSSIRYAIPETAGCIFYNERSGDLDGDLGKLIEKLRQI